MVGFVQYKICKFFDWLRDRDVRLVLLKFRRYTAGQDFMRCAFVTNHCMQRMPLHATFQSPDIYIFLLLSRMDLLKAQKRNILPLSTAASKFSAKISPDIEILSIFMNQALKSCYRTIRANSILLLSWRLAIFLFLEL